MHPSFANYQTFHNRPEVWVNFTILNIRIKKKAAEIITGANIPNEKIQRIFDFCRGNDLILFPVETYDQMKRLFDEINKADNHMITLKQSGPSN